MLTTGGVLLSLALTGAAVAQDGQVRASAEICVLLDDKGQVLDARLAETSGDPRIDQDAIDLARKLQWEPPYPKPGWLGVRITLGGTPGPMPEQSLPHCSSSSDDRYSDAI